MGAATAAHLSGMEYISIVWNHLCPLSRVSLNDVEELVGELVLSSGKEHYINNI